jgi:predicted AlkP superfamily pyrophosphatase or phosphodiesterase
MLFLVTDSHWTTEIGIQQLVKKVLFIIADGIPADVIENASVANMKHIQEIGAYTRAYVGGDKGTYTETATISSPGYMSLLTGTWGNKHNVYDNYVKNPNYHYKNIFRLVKEQQPDRRIGIFSTWTTNRVKLIGEGLLEAGNITFDYKFDGYELDRITYPHDKQSRYIYNIDQRVTNETSKCIRTHAPDLSWVYLQYTDDIGHYFGDSEQFSQSIIYLDEQIGSIWDAIDYRMKYHKEDWLTIITTDHGRDPKKGKHHAGQSVRERTTWIVTNNQETNTYFHDFQPGIVDLLPTIARFMNFTIPMDSERELDGIPLIGKVSLIKPNASLNGDILNISWTVLHDTGNVAIWLSTSNFFKKGVTDNYKLIEVVSIDKKMVVIDVKEYPSKFYKIVLEGQYNTVNKWVYRQWRRNRT